MGVGTALLSPEQISRLREEHFEDINNIIEKELMSNEEIKNILQRKVDEYLLKHNLKASSSTE